MKKTHHIGISFGQIDSLSDGLGEFSTQISTQLARQAVRLREEFGISIHLHMPAQWHGRFGEDVHYIDRRKIHRYMHWPAVRFSVWHTLNQLSRLQPPAFSHHRIITIHDLNFLYTEDQRRVERQVRKLRHRINKYDHVTTLTHYVEGDIRNHLGWEKPIDVIPNGVRDLTSEPAEAIPSLINRPFFFHLSRLASSKNPECLLELARHWPERHFVLAGPASTSADGLRKQGAELGLRNFEILENISDAQKTWLFRHCSAFLFPSLTEGFGLPPLEAMYFGKPVFVANRTCLPEVVGSWAGYFDSFAAADMRACMEAMLPRLQEHNADIRAHASNFTWEGATQAYLALYMKYIV